MSVEKTPNKEFPDLETWLMTHGRDVEQEWQWIHDEYGDAAPFLSEFKEQRYREAKAEYTLQNKD